MDNETAYIDAHVRSETWPRQQLISHLVLLGYMPVMAATAAVQKDTVRMFVMRRWHQDSEAREYFTTGIYEHPHKLTRTEVPWDSYTDAQLRMLFARAVLYETAEP